MIGRVYVDVMQASSGWNGDKVLMSSKPKKCKKQNCKTWLSRYRIAKGAKYCCVHEHIGIKKADIAEVELLIKRSREAANKEAIRRKLNNK